MKAISPVIATVIIVAVTIAITIAVALWITGVTTSFTGVEKLEIVNAYVQEYPSSYHVVILVKNTGTRTATIDQLFINGKPYENKVLHVYSHNLNGFNQSNQFWVGIPTENYNTIYAMISEDALMENYKPHPEYVPSTFQLNPVYPTRVDILYVEMKTESINGNTSLCYVDFSWAWNGSYVFPRIIYYDENWNPINVDEILNHKIAYDNKWHNYMIEIAVKDNTTYNTYDIMAKWYYDGRPIYSTVITNATQRILENFYIAAHAQVTGGAADFDIYEDNVYYRATFNVSYATPRVFTRTGLIDFETASIGAPVSSGTGARTPLYHRTIVSLFQFALQYLSYSNTTVYANIVTSPGLTHTLKPGESCTLIVLLPHNKFSHGQMIDIKIHTASGGSYPKLVRIP